MADPIPACIWYLQNGRIFLDSHWSHLDRRGGYDFEVFHNYVGENRGRTYYEKILQVVQKTGSHYFSRQRGKFQVQIRVSHSNTKEGMI